MVRPVHGDREEATVRHVTGALLQAHEHQLVGEPAATLPLIGQQTDAAKIVTPRQGAANSDALRRPTSSASARTRVELSPQTPRTAKAASRSHHVLKSNVNAPETITHLRYLIRMRIGSGGGESSRSAAGSVAGEELTCVRRSSVAGSVVGEPTASSREFCCATCAAKSIAGCRRFGTPLTEGGAPATPAAVRGGAVLPVDAPAD